MVRVAKLKSRQRKLELARAMGAAASAGDFAKTIVTKALYEMEISLSNSFSFDLERFIAIAEAVDAAQTASTAAANVLANATSRFGGISIE